MNFATEEGANLTISGKINGANTITKSGTGRLTISGEATFNTLNQTAGTLNITGTATKNITTATISDNATEMNISGAATITTLNQSAGTLNISGAATIRTLNVTGGTGMTLSGTSVSIGTLENKSTETISIGTGSGDTKVVAVNRFDIGDVNNTTENSLNIKSDAVLKITGSTDGYDGSTATYDTASLLLGEWKSKTVATIEGKLLAQNASALAGDTGYEMTVADGGVLAVKGLGQAKNAVSNVKLTLSDGGTAIFGSAGISLQNATKWLPFLDIFDFFV